jgi:NAD(P)H-flavin reductase
VGLVTQLVPRTLHERTTALLCGPEVMMRLVADLLVDRGLPPAAVRVSLERNMKCAVGLCGHCQLREFFVCTDGPVLGYDRIGPLVMTREL